MAKKFNVKHLSKQQMAAQLRKPEGKDGQEVAKQMNKGNKHICLNSYKVLKPQNNSTIVEIGMGNGLYISDLLSKAEGLKYIGVDFSKTMLDEATLLNKQLVNDKKVSFINASIANLPLLDDTVDAVTTTNTIYFWPNLEENAKEIYRVLKPEGKVLIGYRSKALMDKIELTQYNFNKYTRLEVEALLEKTGFRNIETQIIAEPDLDFDGEFIKMEGFYTFGIK